MITTPDGRRLHTMVDGPEQDTLVVLDAGLGISGLYWTLVHRLLSQKFRVVAYDRAGMGASDPTSRPRTLELLAADLQAVVDAFPHRQVILVGHSWGGPIARVAAARRLTAGLRDIAGIVLADQSDENDEQFFSASMRWQLAGQAAAMVPLARIGLLAPLCAPMTLGLPDPVRRAVAEASCTPRAARAAASEERPVIDELLWLRVHPLELGDLPIRVLSGQQVRWFEKQSRAELVRAHRITANMYAGASYVPAHGSGHMIPIAEPELIADHVSDLAGWVTPGRRRPA